MMLLQLALMGDSIVQGFGLYDIENGGQGCHAELIFERLANLSGYGPLIGPGFRGIWRDAAINANSGSEWSSAGAWTKTASTDAFDKGLGGYGYTGNGGAGVTRKWTRPRQWRQVNGGICVEYADTGGNWQYRINDGTWTNHGQTIANNNAYKRFYLSGSGIQSIEFRAYDGASNAAICLFGVEPYYVTPQGASGFIGHNLGISGIDLHDIALSGSGDRLASLDTVTLGTGAPISRQPTLVVAGPYSNDVPDINNATTWATDITTLRNRVASFATFAFVNVYEQGSARNTTTQATYRAQTKTTCGAFSPAALVKDIYDDWTALGVGTFTTARSPGGLLDIGSVHPSQLGYLELATRIYWFVRTQLLAIGTLPSTYPAPATQTATAHVSKITTAVVYSAATPIGVG